MMRINLLIRIFQKDLIWNTGKRGCTNHAWGCDKLKVLYLPYYSAYNQHSRNFLPSDTWIESSNNKCNELFQGKNTVGSQSLQANKQTSDSLSRPILRNWKNIPDTLNDLKDGLTTNYTISWKEIKSLPIGVLTIPTIPFPWMMPRTELEHFYFTI